MKIPKPFFFKSADSNSSTNSDLSFGDSIEGSYSRLLDDHGSFNITRKGGSPLNFFKSMISISWWKFFLWMLLVYFVLNILFSLLYYIDYQNGIRNIESGSFAYHIEQLFYFSVQTFTTVGYGHLNPSSTYTNLIATLNAFTGLMFFALATGMFFSKFSSPIKQIIFSEKILISPFIEGNALMLRIANAYDNQILNLKAKMTMTWIVEIDGVPRRKFAGLPLQIETISLFPLNWTIVHPINKSSPLFHKSENELLMDNAEFIIMIEGYDQTYAKYIHHMRSYACDNLVYGGVFSTMYETRNNETILHLNNINDYREVVLNKKDGIDN